MLLRFNWKCFLVQILHVCLHMNRWWTYTYCFLLQDVLFAHDVEKSMHTEHRCITTVLYVVEEHRSSVLTVTNVSRAGLAYKCTWNWPAEWPLRELTTVICIWRFNKISTKQKWNDTKTHCLTVFFFNYLLPRPYFSGRTTCEACSKSFKNKRVLVEHLRLDCGRSKDFACNLCDFRSKRKACLKRHTLLKHHHLLIA